MIDYRSIAYVFETRLKELEFERSKAASEQDRDKILEYVHYIRELRNLYSMLHEQMAEIMDDMEVENE